ncbi:MAG TPA: UDP-3-O-acyl-N-acetylglucosamine deacetylase [Candidatus Baltobacteraceae bacterium]|nr:UDP-3-O-acyl-N-acetylglucosamine deacetylase [Candidatus Baltobacteraceae bacterium]
MIEQNTLRAALRFQGVGLHTGAPASVEVQPAPVDSGITFVVASATDSKTPVRVPATAEYVIDTSRATVLGRDGASISTTEHLLSALFAMGVSNADVCVDGPEIPICDGSARGFVEAIDAIGMQPQGRPRVEFTPQEPLFLQRQERMLAVFPSPVFRVRFVADFPAPIGTQYYYRDVDAAGYRDDIAGARTFGYLHEVEALRARGLALGGTLDNAVVFAPDGPMQPLRWNDEVVRHKVLDLIGDLALLGAWPRCEVVAIKTGHEMHAAAVRALRSQNAVGGSRVWPN